jgi:hypothetical protein
VLAAAAEERPVVCVVDDEHSPLHSSPHGASRSPSDSGLGTDWPAAGQPADATPPHPGTKIESQ